MHDTIEKGPFEPTWESLGQYRCPEWFRDAKFGIWSHWGPQSVPMYGDWYARHMYVEGHPQYLHHWRKYGHPSRHGWKDMIKLWKAERFEPDGLMDLYVAAGAKYFVAQANHHDNFDNWNSKHQPWNATRVGPLKDIVGLWREAARRRGLRFGVTEHLGASFTWWEQNKRADAAGPYAGVPYDGNDEAFADLYHRNRGCPLQPSPATWQWYTDNADYHAQWLRRIQDLVDQHQPDLLYSDGGLPFYWQTPEQHGRKQILVNCPDPGLRLVAHLYNLSARLHGGVNEAVYNQKDATSHVAAIGVLDIERGQENAIKPYVWQTDTCVGGWFYDVRQVYKTPTHVIEMLVDIVSKNGNLLLNLPQRPDGTLDDECLNILRQLAAWFKVNAAGIHGTRPWRAAGEGPTVHESKAGSFKEDAATWTTADFRFTSKGSNVFAFQMKAPAQPGGEAFVRSLGKTAGVAVKTVRLPGCRKELWHRQCEDGLLVRYPSPQPCATVPGIEVVLAQ